jgi:hypothetical protein
MNQYSRAALSRHNIPITTAMRWSRPWAGHAALQRADSIVSTPVVTASERKAGRLLAFTATGLFVGLLLLHAF